MKLGLVGKLDKNKRKNITVALFVALIAFIGVYVLTSSHAATPYISLNADKGTSTAPATVQSCSGASDGSCVVFGSAPGGGGGCSLSSFTATNQPSCWQPFSSSSPLNVPIPPSPKLASYSSTVINHLITYNWQFQNNGANTFKFPGSTDGRPTYFAHPTDPLIKIASCSGRCKDQTGNSIVGMSFHIPLNATPGTNGDSHLDVIETDTGDEYGFWQAHVDYGAGTMTATNGDKLSTITGSGVQLQVGADAAHFSLVGGLVRPTELLDATNSHSYIKHALVLDVPCVANGSTSGIPSSVYPGLYSNGSTIPSDGCVDASKGDGPPYGSLFALNMSDTDIQNSGAPSWEQTIMKTLAHYGAYVTDTQSEENLYIFKQSCESWQSIGALDIQQSVFQQLGSSDGSYYSSNTCASLSNTNYGLKSSVPIPVNKLQVVDPCVPKRAC